METYTLSEWAVGMLASSNVPALQYSPEGRQGPPLLAHRRKPPPALHAGRCRDEPRIEAHILMCFLAYCLSVTLRRRLMAHAPGLTPRDVLESLAGILMLDVHLPQADGCALVLPRYTQPESEHRLILQKLGWELPRQPQRRHGEPRGASRD